jgi:peptidyl-prolyl cis-trans isomerase A (cyclophilin A)
LARREIVMSMNRVPLIVLSAFLAGCSTAPEKKAEVAEKLKTPDQYRVKLDTSKGPVMIEVTRDWAPRGADRFYELVKSGFYDEARFYRVVPKFVVQFGVNKDPKVSALWSQLKIVDDPVKQSNKRGMVSFATDGPNTRTTQLFINLADNPNLDGRRFAPFGKVVEGMETVDNFYKVYGEMPPRGNGPDGNKIEAMGNEYLQRNFPRLDYIKTARVE